MPDYSVSSINSLVQITVTEGDARAGDKHLHAGLPWQDADGESGGRILRVKILFLPSPIPTGLGIGSNGVAFLSNRGIKDSRASRPFQKLLERRN